MAWFYLLLAGLFEMGWPLGFKLAGESPRFHLLYLSLAVVSMALSGWLLYLAQRDISMGTAYLVWTGIGLFFHDAVTVWRLFFLSLVLIGIVGLKMVH